MMYILVCVLSFGIAFYLLPSLIERLIERGHTVFDYYKPDKPEIPTHGAIVVIFSCFLVSAFTPLLGRILNTLGFFNTSYNFEELDISLFLIVSMFAIFGMIDDLLNIGWLNKIIIPLFFTFPLMVSFVPITFAIPHVTEIDLSQKIYLEYDYSDFFKVIIIPIYVMVVTNLVNMHSGFNGLQTGLSSILLVTIIIKCFLDSKFDNLFVTFSILGGLLALWWYNKYPAHIIEGNIGSLAVGSIIGVTLVIKEYYFFGIIILIPHIADFLMLVYTKLSGINFVKFGEINDSGIIKPPNGLKMKFLFPYYFDMKENQIVNILHLVTALFCFVGIAFF